MVEQLIAMVGRIPKQLQDMKDELRAEMHGIRDELRAEMHESVMSCGRRCKGCM